MVFRLNKNRSGMIMVIVTMMVIVLSVVMVGLIGRNFSFVLSSEEQLRRVEAEMVAKGAFWRLYQANGSAPSNYFETVDGRQYNVTFIITPLAGINQINAVVTY